MSDGKIKSSVCTYYYNEFTKCWIHPMKIQHSAIEFIPTH